MRRAVASAFLLLVTVQPLAAQAPLTATSSDALDPAKLAAARALLDVVVPPQARSAIIEGMVRPMMANIQQGILSNERFAKIIGSNPKAKTAFEAFIERRNEATLSKLQSALPGMFSAMERAYARRFTIPQMADAQAFFSTPSGIAYMREGMSIMSDPDVQAWQRGIMQDALEGAQSDAAKLATELSEVEEGK